MESLSFVLSWFTMSRIPRSFSVASWSQMCFQGSPAFHQEPPVIFNGANLSDKVCPTLTSVLPQTAEWMNTQREGETEGTCQEKWKSFIHNRVFFVFFTESVEVVILLQMSTSVPLGFVLCYLRNSLRVSSDNASAMNLVWTIGYYISEWYHHLFYGVSTIASA